MSRRKKFVKLEPFKEIPQLEWEEQRDADVRSRLDVKPKNKNQEKYINAIETAVLTCATGQAGTGKSYVACGVAVKLFMAGTIDKIILTRPIVECGHEKIGFLPGNSLEKCEPYMRPLLDALEDFLGEKEVDNLIEEGAIIISPIGQMRGSSFKNSIILVDEAQNLNYVQLKMTLTRMGQNCRMVLMGDNTQNDLGFIQTDFDRVIKKLSVLPEVAMVHFTIEDVVRSGIVRRILEVLD